MIVKQSIDEVDRNQEGQRVAPRLILIKKACVYISLRVFISANFR